MLATTEAVLRLYLSADGPSIPIGFPDTDLTGSIIEVVITPRCGAPVTLSTETGELTLALPSGVILTYDAAFAAGLPRGRRSVFDVFRTIGGRRTKLGSGLVYVGGAGEFERANPVQVETPGAPGPRGPKGEPGNSAHWQLAFSDTRNTCLLPLIFWV